MVVRIAGCEEVRSALYISSIGRPKPSTSSFRCVAPRRATGFRKEGAERSTPSSGFVTPAVNQAAADLWVLRTQIQERVLPRVRLGRRRHGAAGERCRKSYNNYTFAVEHDLFPFLGLMTNVLFLSARWRWPTLCHSLTDKVLK